LELSAYATIRVGAAYLSWLNRQHAARRVALGKTGEVVDESLEKYKGSSGNAKALSNDQAFDDLTDLQNEDFIYVL